MGSKTEPTENSPDNRKRKIQDETKNNTKKLRVSDLFIEQIVKKTSIKKPSPKKQPKKEPLTLNTLKVDDFVAVKPESHYPNIKPLLARVTSIDLEEETFQAVWWIKKQSSGSKDVGKLLYEFKWAPDRENLEENGFCIEDIFEKLQLRSNMKLSAKGAKQMEKIYGLESDHVSTK